MPVTISAQETIMADLVTQLETIIAGTVYRNTVQLVSKHDLPLDQIMAFPMVFIVFNESRVDSINNSKTTFAEFFQIAVIGYIKSATLSDKNSNSALIDAANSLLHDVKKCLAQFVTTNLNDATKRYMIANYSPLFRVFSPLPTTDMMHAAVGIQFEIKTIAQDYTFAI
jgi:hypothetical protein